MIKRIVKLTFQEDKTEDFRAIFEDNKSKIRGFEGCHHVELLNAKPQGNVFFTFSIWENEEALQNYRQSELFQNTWRKTKALFSDKPEAWTVGLISEG
jgi:quinol monooxygenase YgiN